MLGKDIRELVLVKMEEYTPFLEANGEVLLAAGGGDLLQEVKPIYSYIDRSLHEGANEALTVIPIEHLTPIAADPLNDKDHIKLTAEGAELYPLTSSDAGAEYNGVTYGHRVLNNYITFKRERDNVEVIVTAYRDTAGDTSDSEHDYACYKMVSFGQGEVYYAAYYIRGAFPITPSQNDTIYQFVEDEVVATTFTVNSVNTGSTDDLNGHDDQLFGTWYRGWKNGSTTVYTLGNSLPAVNDTAYSLSGSSMVSAGTVAVVSIIPRVMVEVSESDSVIGSFDKPSVWLRLHTLWMNGWRRPVHSVIRPDNRLYVEQSSPVSRGTFTKPVAVDDGRAIHYFSQPATATSGQIDKLLYIPMFDEDTDYPLEVAEVIALTVAGKIYEVFSQTEQVTLLTKEAESVISTMKL